MRWVTIIEIPKGSDRRIHMRYDGSGFEDFGPIAEKIPVNGGVMPVAYGYVEGVINEVEGDNVDAIVLSNKEYKTGDKVEVEVIGLMNRDDGDHKIITRDDSVNYQSFDEVPEEERKLILEFFGYGHKLDLAGKSGALEYLKSCGLQ